MLHFIPELDGIFGEAERMLAAGGVFAFTTRQPTGPAGPPAPFERRTTGEFEIFSHASAHVEALLAQHGFTVLKAQRCFVGDNVFLLWVAGRR